MQNYETLKDELSQILENQRISKKKQDQILETTQRGFIGIALRNEELLKSNDQLKQQLDDVLKELIQPAEGPTYIHVRTRIALCILAVTGIRINELLPLKVSQLETLFKENWIAIDRSKRGPSNHKAFLTKEGKKIIQDRQKDFQLIFLFKEPDSYLFTP